MKTIEKLMGICATTICLACAFILTIFILGVTQNSYDPSTWTDGYICGFYFIMIPCTIIYIGMFAAIVFDYDDKKQ